MKTVAVIGGAGYVARELITCLVRHSKVKIIQVVSESQQGKSVAGFHKDHGIPEDLVFSGQFDQRSDLVFLCGGHGLSETFLAEHPLENTVVIDLSMDFRTHPDFVYGLPEIHKNKLNDRIANPGCFATAIQLGILPTLGIHDGDWHIHALTGSSGAGQQLQASSHFSWRENNVSAYKVFEHQHELEMSYNGKKVAGSQGKKAFPKLHFTPLRGPFTRGIFATLYTETQWTETEVLELYKNYYAGAAFTKVVQQELDLKQVVGTNFCLLHPAVKDGKLFVTVVIDNLLKGAAGQAIQNMNSRFGWEETTGLDLKPTFL